MTRSEGSLFHVAGGSDLGLEQVLTPGQQWGTPCLPRKAEVPSQAQGESSGAPGRSPRWGIRGQDCAALTAQLLEAKGPAVPRRGPGLRSPEAGWLGTFRDWLPWALSLLQDRHIVGQGTCCAVSWGGQDHMDGQILGQLRPLAEQEEEEEVGARAAPSARPAFPGMGSEELRLASFYDWPLTTVVRPEVLAAAGFFHTGQQDKVRCFFCYGGLQSWEQGDDPWTEHAKWFPRCEFLLQTKGRDFVCSVQEACCHLPGSWDRPEEPEDGAPAPPSGAGGSQEWSAWSRCPAVRAVLRMGFGPSRVQQLLQRRYRWAVPAGISASQLVADLLQEEEGGQVTVARAPVHTGPELPTPRREVQSEGAREPGARDTEEQLPSLREERTCKVCWDRAVGTVLVPCGHLVCAACAPALQLCPICRAPIRSRVRTFLP
ncbi:PREDICTED: baculoviral IAP repeat-containing protein 7 [Odobenus rosmarus divergens]|uniref:RING-type E3 ubiquitin transferase n=1 Tax=Odobenus rosmarus divergens TaxID=9708 RepID=A0A2U3WMI2_ODORO|nr:PREDICTED: baculoviral IAP repeat-containing protein 7 [Odobenus rosmarus divergens]